MKLSVCIPVYNVAPYIEKCVRSLFEQTYRDIEYIFVDDCTPDDSIAIVERVLKDYPNRTNQVRILRHEENRGAAFARKTAVTVSQGELIAFCDADDWVDCDLYRRMIARMVECEADAVMCSALLEYPNGRTRLVGVEMLSMTGRQVVCEMTGIPGASSLVLRIVRREVIVNPDIERPDGLKCGEDLMLSAQILYHSARFVSIDSDCCYHYRQNVESTIHTVSADRIIQDHIKVYDVLTRRIPDDTGRNIRCYVVGVILFWGTVNALLSRTEFRRWRDRFSSLGGRWEWLDKSLWGQRMMKLADLSYPLARIFAPFVRRKIDDYL